MKNGFELGNLLLKRLIVAAQTLTVKWDKENLKYIFITDGYLLNYFFDDRVGPWKRTRKANIL